MNRFQVWLQKLLEAIARAFVTGTPNTYSQSKVATKTKDISHIKKWEGLELEAYLCPANVWTIGYGHTKTARPGMVITKAEADHLLRQDLRWVDQAINEYVKVDLNQNQFDALSSFIFNLGSGNFKSSTLLKKLNKGDFKGAAEEFLRWDKARVNGKLVSLRGLRLRRQDEKDLFLREPL